MKKYLITAAMAVAVSGTFVSCHDDEITGSTVEQKIQAFEDIFTQAFGKPAPNHTFGFGDPIVLEGVTRSVDVNGNMWESRPEVTAEEAAAVYAWVNKPKNQIPPESYYEESPVNMKNFFVTQVWGKDNNTNDPNAKYKDYDNGNVFGGEKMNHLQISKSAERLGINGVASANNGEGAINDNWDHANNFNASQNRDWDGNTMFVDWGTQNFAYHNSTDSKYHDKWIIVDGAYITDSKGINHAGKYYVCFDFIARNPNAYTNFQDANGQNYEVPGAWKSVEEAVAAGAKARIQKGWDSANNVGIYEEGPAVQSNWTKGNISGGNMIVDANEYYTDWIVRLVEAKPKNIPQVKVVSGSTTTEGYVARKIVSGEIVMKSGRIFCEDIVSAKYALEDLDYNDVVFDAAIINKYRKLETTYLDKNRNPIVFSNGDPNPKIEYNFDISDQANGYNSLYAIVRLLAAGGTLPIEIKVPGQHNADVHNVLGQTSTTIMINTLDKGEREWVNMAAVASPVPAEDFKKASGDEREKFYNVNDLDNGIELNVEYGNVAAGIKSKYYDGETGEVVASAKYMVPLGTPWAKERVKITDAYPRFNDWIDNESVKFWDYPALDENNSIDKSKFYDYDGKKVVGLDPVKYAKDNIISNNGKEEVIDLGEEEMTSSITTESFTAATNTFMATPTGTTIYDYNATNVGPGYLYDGSTVTASSSTDITAGSKIRVYGVSINNWEVTCSGLGITASAYTGDGYIEFDVTKDLGRSLAFTGKNFTITYVTIVEATPTPVVDDDETPETPSGDGGWSSTTYTNQDLISADDLKSKGIGKGKAATLKITGTAFNWGTAGWEVRIMNSNRGNVISKHSNNNPELGQFDSNLNGFISIPIEIDILNNLLDTGGLRIYINLNGYTNVEIFQ